MAWNALVLQSLFWLGAFATPATADGVDRARWEVVDMDTTRDLYQIWGTDDEHVWVTDGSELHFWNGTTWARQDVPLASMVAISGTGPADAWVLSVEGDLARWDGTAWRYQAGSGETSFFSSADFTWAQDFWIDETGVIWVVGSSSQLGVWNGTSWVPGTTPDDLTINWLYGVQGIDRENIWVSTNEAGLLRWDGGQWREIKLLAPEVFEAEVLYDLEDLSVVDAFNVWVVAVNPGAIFRCRKGAWSRQALDTRENLRAVEALNADNAWAVGDRGTIVRWDGTAWSVQDSGTAENLTDLWISSDGTLWAVGTSGTVLRSTQHLQAASMVMEDGFDPATDRPAC